VLYVLYSIPAKDLLGAAPTLDGLPPAPQNSGIVERAEWDTVPNSPWEWSRDVLNWVVPSVNNDVVSRQVFMDDIGAVEVANIILASRADTLQGAMIAGWLLRYQVVPDVNRKDPRTVAGIDFLISAGLIPANKRDTVLGLV